MASGAPVASTSTAPQKQRPTWLIDFLLHGLSNDAVIRRSVIAVQFTNYTRSSLRQACGTAIDRSARKLTLLGERAQPEPDLHRGGKLAASRQYHSLACYRGAYCIESQPDRRHGAKIGGYIEVDVEAGIDLAQIGAGLGIDDQPEVPIRRWQGGIDELHHAATDRHRRGVEVPPHVPHQEIDIEVLQRQVRFDPPLPPDSERLHQRPELTPGFRQMIFEEGGIGRRRGPGNNARCFKLL